MNKFEVVQALDIKETLRIVKPQYRSQVKELLNCENIRLFDGLDSKIIAPDDGYFVDPEKFEPFLFINETTDDNIEMLASVSFIGGVLYCALVFFSKGHGSLASLMTLDQNDPQKYTQLDVLDGKFKSHTRIDVDSLASKAIEVTLPLVYKVIYGTMYESISIRDMPPNTHKFNKKVPPYKRQLYTTYQIILKNIDEVDTKTLPKTREGLFKLINRNTADITGLLNPNRALEYIDRLNKSVLISGFVCKDGDPLINELNLPFDDVTLAGSVCIPGASGQSLTIATHLKRLRSGVIEVTVFVDGAFNIDKKPELLLHGVYTIDDRFKLTRSFMRLMDYKSTDITAVQSEDSPFNREQKAWIQSITATFIRSSLHKLFEYETTKVSGRFFSTKVKQRDPDWVPHQNVHLVLDITKRRQHTAGTGMHGGWTMPEHERIGHYRRYKSGKVVFVKACKINAGKATTHGSITKDYVI